MLDEHFQNVLATAGACASRLGHSEVTVTHVTYALCAAGALDIAFRKMGKSVSDFFEMLEKRLAASDVFSMSFDGAVAPSESLSKCLSNAEKSALLHGRAFINNEDFLIAALEAPHGSPGDDLARVTFLEATGHSESVSPEAPSRSISEGAKALTTWSRNLVAAARAGELDEVFGRSLEIERIQKILARRKKGNPILVGEPGVGKTAVVEGLAVLIANGRVPTFLRTKEIYALDMNAILAGTGNRGDLEARFKTVLDAARSDPNAILFIDEIHAIMSGTGAMAGVADLMKPILAGSGIKCIGATTRDEFSRHFEGDPAMVRRFQDVPVMEPTRDEAIEIIKKAVVAYEAHHEVEYSEEAVVAAVDLSIRHLSDRQLPDKALDVIDEAGASVRGRDATLVTGEDVLAVIRDMSGDKFAGVSDDAVWTSLETRLNAEAQGLEDIVSGITEFLRSAARHPSARQGAKARFLLEGPSGSGKRYLAESLSRALGVPLLALDMSAYAERSSISGLIGAPPGYIGYDNGGKLTEFARRHPMGIVLVEGLEKANAVVQDLLANAIMQGWISDSRGRRASFRNSIIMVLRDERPAPEPIGFLGRATERDKHQGFGGVSFDHTFTLRHPDFAAASAILSRMLDEVKRTYAVSGVDLEFEHDVLAALMLEGKRRGGRAGDYVSSYTDLFERPLFRSEMPRRGSMKAVVQDDGITMEVTNAMAS